MATVRRGPALRTFWRIHRWILQASQGRLGQRLGPGRQLLLVTTGRKSGEPRPVALTYLEDGGRWIVVASNAGDDRDPTWWLNLAAHPRAQVMIGGRTVPVIAREVQDPEREALYRRFIDDIDRSYAEYQTQTTRRIPVVALQPEETA
ncbi:MAG TPA: nitroreductase/quinone reductase family protein [Acidimicrobiia bacterium]|nr:nitroreductase/quinone reductase family protein [Acidimicrobiia bacterium]